jgi:predicted TPR repeat methyltransferase
LFANVDALMTPDALFAFSVETHAGPEPYTLRPSLRFAHSAPAVESQLSACGMRTLSKSSVVLRQDRGEPVMGMIFVAAGSKRV